jgi:hypothetical protein
MLGERFGRLQERFSDRLLTALTIMLLVLLFVVSPLQAAGVVEAHHFGLAFGLVLVAAVFIVSGSAIAATFVEISWLHRAICPTKITLAELSQRKAGSAADV